MGIGPSDAGRLTLHEYQGLLWHWNEMHAVPDPAAAKVAPPDPERVRRAIAVANMSMH